MKYVKYNFAVNRIFIDVDDRDYQFLQGSRWYLQLYKNNNELKLKVKSNF